MKKALLIVAGLILAFSAGYLFNRPPADFGARTEVVRDTLFDTIPYFEPVPRDSVILRYVTATLPKAEEADTIKGDTSIAIRDSVAVIIPISQTHYSDSLYDAWVSGYQSKLDSIKLYPPVITNTVTIRKPPNRWAVGPTGGVAVTPKGLQPYIGIGVTYNLFAK